MKKLLNFVNLILLSSFFVSCNSYQLASYYGDNDGIYVSNNRGIDYEVVFNDYANEYSDSDATALDNLPWGANPESIEVVNNFFPNFGRFYYNPFFHSMAYNPFYTNSGRFINYGYTPPFFYDSFAYGLGYPFYGPSNWYFSPYSVSLGNYYWYIMRNSRYYPWYYGKVYNNYNEHVSESSSNSRLNYSRSNSRRGEKNVPSNGVSKKTNSQVVGVSRISPYVRVNGKVNNVDTYDDVIKPNLRVIKRNDVNRVNSSLGSNSRRVNRNLVPNLNRIKSDAVRKAYREIKSVNPNQRNFINRSGNYNSSSNNSNYYNNQSARSNSSYSSGNRVSRPSSSFSTRGGNISSSRSSSSGSRGSSGGSRGSSGNIN